MSKQVAAKSPEEWAQAIADLDLTGIAGILTGYERLVAAIAGSHLVLLETLMAREDLPPDLAEFVVAWAFKHQEIVAATASAVAQHAGEAVH